ncbi:TadE/TadG family type IV pilus assembly protein [Nitratireductor indicus]|uniref:TadE-like domain-containing protein n=1 Tax=Nitratireductor indicus C115 TaxID=1231190 RepID=K2P2K3_9HYPH|nr:TadE/TadG family type IV pilus assembly protein [Nitratireductor indicus]EKF44339.1 hypothetical protein NA8A_01315 [Nitratireductor indicus C115]MDS1137292.1 pilus assembly protein [Nitratireductor indicus]SFQ27721.1 Flp pilus assembly protein TadG [Nitratireductor indicus]
MKNISILPAGEKGIFSTLRRFMSDRRGVAAIEFVIVAPILFGLYFLTLEFAQAIDTNKKVARIGSMVGDLVAQQPSITKNEIDAIMKIGGALLVPYNRSQPEVVITAIEVTNEPTPKVKVVWSRKMVAGTAGNALAAGSITTIPEDLRIPGAFYIRATADIGYKPILTYSSEGKEGMGLMAMTGLQNLKMSESYFLRPRMNNSIACTDC